MRDCRLDVEGLVVERLQLLVVLLGSVHLDLQSVNLQQLSPFLEIIFAVLELISTSGETEKIGAQGNVLKIIFLIKTQPTL